MTFKLHTGIFDKDMSVMFDVNYYATNFILSIPDGIINVGNEKFSVKDHPFL